MSTDLNLHLWWAAEPRASRWDQLCQAIQAWPERVGPWQELALRGPQRAVLAPSGAAPPSAPLPADGCLTSAVTAPAWRFGSGSPEDGVVRVGLEVWGEAYRQRPSLALDGHALLRLPAGPFVALPDPDDRNTLIEANLDRLLGLIEHVVAALGARRVVVCTDAGAHHLLNAHAVWWSEPAEAVRHLKELQAQWREGEPRWKLPSLGSPEALRYADTWHAWRSEAQRREAQARLAPWMGRKPTVAAVTAALASGRFDVLQREPGAMVFDFPHMLNHFVDRFAADVLERSP